MARDYGGDKPVQTFDRLRAPQCSHTKHEVAHLRPGQWPLWNSACACPTKEHIVLGVTVPHGILEKKERQGWNQHYFKVEWVGPGQVERTDGRWELCPMEPYVAGPDGVTEYVAD